MSEFSQSYHMVAEQQADAVALLARAGIGGWVLPASNGWVTFLPDPDAFGVPSPEVVASNFGVLLWYLNAEDHGWSFAVFEDSSSVCAYGCAWEDALVVHDEALDQAVVEALVGVNALDPVGIMPQVHALLHPEGLEQLGGYVVHTEGRNPGHGFAEAIGLEHFHWLSRDYVEADGGTIFGIEDLIRVAPSP